MDKVTAKDKTAGKKKVTAGKDALGDFAPQFARLNDEVLFGEVWSREDKLSPRDRSIITITALLTSGIFDSSFSFHLKKAKENGVTKTALITVGDFLGADYARSKLYDPTFTTEFREASQ